MWGCARQRTIPSRPGPEYSAFGPPTTLGVSVQTLQARSTLASEGHHSPIRGIPDPLVVEARQRRAVPGEDRRSTRGGIIGGVVPGARIAAGDADPVLPRSALHVVHDPEQHRLPRVELAIQLGAVEVPGAGARSPGDGGPA